MSEEWRVFWTQIQGAAVAVGGLFALANCFFGYKLQKVWIALIGFLIGLVGGFAAGMALGLEAEQGDIAARLAALREQGKDKTVQFRELLAQKLTNSNLRLLLERYRLL